MRPSLRSSVAVLLVVALVLAAVGTVAYLYADGEPDYDPVAVALPDDTPPAQQPPDPALASFYDQRLEWAACGDDQCATLTVPLDYDDPGGATIGIHVDRRPADEQDDKVGSLLVNPGGPGEPGSVVAANAAGYFRPALLRYFDIVGFDPRGTGRSAPVDCLSDTDLDAYVAGDPEPSTPAEALTAVRLTRGLGRGCAQLSGALASHVSTQEAARDIDVLRAALGERVTSYFGFSYGTELGATYAELFPGRVGRFVLDGAVDPAADPREEALVQAEGFETALRSYVANCLDVTDSCFLGDSVDEGLQRIRDLLDQVDQEPLTTDSARPLTAGLALYGIVTPLYSRNTWILLSQALRSAFDGDGSSLLRLADAYTSRSSDGTYAKNSMEAIAAISCLDDPEGIRPSQVPAEYPAFEEASPTFGRVFAWGLAACRNWPPARRLETKPLTIDAQGAPPIVVVGTTRDPATPLVWAKAMASQLDSGVLVERDGDGHTGYNSGNECVDGAIESYLIEGVVPPDGLSC